MARKDSGKARTSAGPRQHVSAEMADARRMVFEASREVRSQLGRNPVDVTTRTSVTGAKVAQARQYVDYIETALSRVPAELRRAPANGAPVPAEWFEMPGSDAARVLLYVHGGSYVMPRTALHDALIARLAGQAGATALVIDYRLAPEHPFPASLKDVVSSYRWLLDGGYDPAAIAIVGDSAGGGLALAASVALRDAGIPLRAGILLLSPWADLSMSGVSAIEHGDHDPFMSSLEALMLCAKIYLAGEPATHPLASPVFADLSGLPPLRIHVGRTDVVYDDATRIAESVRRAGGEIELYVREHMPHAWEKLGDLTPESREAIAEGAAFLRRRLAAAEPARKTVSSTGQ
jgi:monoterpene epsilon-lactone hydrolase